MHLESKQFSLSGISLNKAKLYYFLVCCILAFHFGVSLQAGAFSLQTTDWQNRGEAFNLAVDTARSLVYAEMDGGVDHDLAIFDYSNPAQLKYVGLAKGFGCWVRIANGNLYSVAKDRGLCVWNMADPRHPVLTVVMEDTASWWLGSSYASACFAMTGNIIWRLQGTTLTTYECILSNQLLQLQQFTRLPGSIGYDSLIVSDKAVYCASQYTGTYWVCLFDKSTGSLVKKGSISIKSSALTSYAGSTSMISCQSGRFIVLSNRGEDKIHILDVGDLSNPIELVPFVLPNSPLKVNSIVSINADHFMVVRAGGIIQMFRVSTEGVVSPESAEITIPDAWAYTGATGGSYAFITGFYKDLLMMDVTDKSSPKLIGESDPNPSLQNACVDQNYLYQVGEFDWKFTVQKIGERGILGPLQELPEPAGFVAAFQGTVAASYTYDLRVYRRQPNGDHVLASRTEYSSSTTSWSDRTLFINGAYVVIDNQVFGLFSEKQLTLLGSLPSNAKGLFGHFALCVDGDSVDVIDLAKNMSIAQIVPGPVFDMKSCGDRAILKKQDSICVLTSDSNGVLGLNEWFGSPTEPSYGKWNVSFDDNVLLLWSTDTANIYSLNKNAPPRFLGSSPIPRNYCHGGWYGFLSHGLFYTTDAFTGIVVMRLDAGNAISSISKNVDGSVNVEMDTVKGRLYQLHSSSNLVNWELEIGNIRGTGSKLIQQGISAKSMLKYYRAADMGE
jgi:hypothetical protein